MTKSSIRKTGAAVVSVFLVSIALLAMVPGASNDPAPMSNQEVTSATTVDEFLGNDRLGTELPYDTVNVPVENVALAGIENDIGYNCDTGDSILKSLPLYVGEPVDSTVPGRGRTGQLDPSQGDDEDWFIFTACAGQIITASVTSTETFGLSLVDATATVIELPYTADVTSMYFLNVLANDAIGEYTLNVALQGQNDAGSSSDAGNTMASALAVESGSYGGYMSEADREDWYRFQVSAGQGISVRVQPLEKSDYDIHLYTPQGILVHSAQYYGEDELTYMADATGTWYIQLDMFPGWDEELWPDDYFRYGSGAYELDVAIGGSVEHPSEPRSQPDIVPVAQTFVIDNDPTGNADEYNYLAAIPALVCDR